MNSYLNLCQTCLSNDRDLFPIKNLQSLIQEIRLEEMSTLTGGVCWECTGAMKRFSKFRKQVLTAQNIFKGSQVQSQFPTCLSSLTHTHNSSIITCTELEIKEEHTDVLKYESDSIDEKPNLLDFQLEDTDIFSDTLTNVKVKKKSAKKSVVKNIKSESKITIDRTKFEEVTLTEEDMMRHRQEKMDQPNYKKIPFKCDGCVLGFLSEKNLLIHMKKKHREDIGDHICNICTMRFRTGYSLYRHRDKHFTHYKCLLCDYVCSEPSWALNHTKVKHREVDELRCGRCVYDARNRDDLNDHMKKHAIQCSECMGTFKDTNILRKHKQRLHGAKRKFQCDLCKKRFPTKSRLESHMVNHNTSIAQKLSFCIECNVQYKNLSVYRNHLMNSANHAQNAFQCSDCGKKFSSKAYWQRHYSFYHLRQSSYVCDECSKPFISSWRLRNHKQTQHGDTRTRDHCCNVCGKKFYTLSTLKCHVLTHSEQRTFMCEDCGATFKQKPSLYTHCRLVHKGIQRPHRKRVKLTD